MVSDATGETDRRADRADAPDAHPDDDGATGAAVVDRWTALDRGWQALALGLGIVGAHLVGQAL